MKLLSKLFFILSSLALTTGAVFFFINKNKKKNLKDPLECGLYLAIGRKRLIHSLNQQIAEVEDRTSKWNHAKRQKELEEMDWNIPNDSSASSNA